MKDNETGMVSCGLVSDRGVQDYIHSTRIDKDSTYSTDVEVFVLAHLMPASMLVYKIDLDVWQRHSPALVDPNFNDDLTQMAMCIRNSSCHFDVILSVCDPPQSEYKKEYSRACYKVNPDLKTKVSWIHLAYMYGSIGMAILFKQCYS